jgi:hypothetical protein
MIFSYLFDRKYNHFFKLHQMAENQCTKWRRFIAPNGGKINTPNGEDLLYQMTGS